MIDVLTSESPAREPGGVVARAEPYSPFFRGRDQSRV